MTSKSILSVLPTGYTPRGSEETINGLKTYITGRRDATAGVVDVYDVFGMSDYTKQGADLIAEALDAVVVIPDFLKGTFAKSEWFPLDTEEKRGQFFGFLKGYAFPYQYTSALMESMEEYKYRFPSVTKWGSFGLCWGGKVVALTSKSGSPFTASAQAHPGMLDPTDAKEIAIPHIVLASKDEPGEQVAEYKSIIEANGVGGFVITYPDMYHGWMGSKANLEKEESLAGYTQGYTQFIEFFREYLNEQSPHPQTS